MDRQTARRERLVGRSVLVAQEVRQRLFDSLGPAWRATFAGLAAHPQLSAPEDVLLLVSFRPALLRVVVQAREGRPAAELVRCPLTAFPHDGADVEDAVGAYIAGTLSAMDLAAAEHATRYAQAVGTRGGFLLAVSPATGQSRLFLAKAGEDLSEALDLGGIGEMPTTSH